MPSLTTFWTGPPTHVRVYPCPSCQETISVDALRCRFCYEPVDGKVAEQCWAKNQQLGIEKQQIATAISRAHIYWTVTCVSMLMTALTLWRTYPLGSLGETWVICQLLAISYGAQWLNHNSSLVTNDADYLKAVAKVKQTTLLWVALLLIQVAAYFILNGLPDWNTILELLVVE